MIIEKLFCQGDFGSQVKCPFCGFEYSHIREVFTRAGTFLQERTNGRQSELVVVFDGECEHSWNMIIRQYKGISQLDIENCTVEDHDDMD